MKLLRGVFATAALGAAALATSVLLAAAGQTPQSEFVPTNQLPAQESLPGAPLVYAGYAVAWVAVLIYVWMLWRRAGRLEHDLADVHAKLRARAGGRA